MWFLSFVIFVYGAGFSVETMPAPDKDSCNQAAQEVIKIQTEEFTIPVAACFYKNEREG